MPTYEYKCRECGHTFERYQRISEDPLEECPECHGRVQRLISSGGGLVFKGPGFYATDYRSSGTAGRSSKEGSGSASSDKSGSEEGAGSA